MAKLSIEIKDLNNIVKYQIENENEAVLCLNTKYQAGDCIVVKSSTYPIYVVMQLDATMDPSLVYMTNDFVLIVPQGKEKLSYNPKSFTSDASKLSVRVALDSETSKYMNLAVNPYDSHENISCFPHAFANSETRGEAIFYARNAIDGNCLNKSHGKWPYESWGINKNPKAELTIDFHRPVIVDKVVLFTRADFPHDSWWRQVDIHFSNEEVKTVELKKTSNPQVFEFDPIKVTWIRLENLIKQERNISPFPALSEIEVYGRNK